MKDSQRINNLNWWAQLSLFGISYSPLFFILGVKILYSRSEYLHWGGLNINALILFVEQFWVVILVSFILIFSVIGTTILLKNINDVAKNNSQNIIVKNIVDKNIETINYIATYIIPFVYDVQSNFDILIMLLIFIVIYFIFVNSSLVVVNPILAIWYGLYEVECEVGNKTKSIIVISKNKYLIEGDEINIYPIGRKLYLSYK